MTRHTGPNNSTLLYSVINAERDFTGTEENGHASVVLWPGNGLSE